MLALLLAACSQEPRQPNVLLVVIDTLNASHTSAYGYERDTTPRLSEFAAMGTRFDAAYAPMGLTGPSHATIFTSLYPAGHGVLKNGLSLSEDATTLAESLGAAGYQTAAVVSSFVLARKFGFAQGFSFYDDALDPSEATMSTSSWEGHVVATGFDRRGDHTTRRAREWLEERRSPSEPFFLFVHYFDAHSPYDAPQQHRAEFIDDDAPGDELDLIIAEYDAEVHFADAMVGELLDVLEQQGLADDTLVVITADHGEGLMQHGYMLHGVSLFDEEVRVPLMMRWPGRIEPERLIEAPVALADLAATILELVGVANPIESEGSPEILSQSGSSLAPALVGDAILDARRPIYLYRRHYHRAFVKPAYLAHRSPSIPVDGSQHGIRKGRWKYIFGPEEKLHALYDLQVDPEERHDVVPGESKRAARMQAIVRQWASHFQSADETPPVAEEDLEKLRALGYTD